MTNQNPFRPVGSHNMFSSGQPEPSVLPSGNRYHSGGYVVRTTPKATPDSQAPPTGTPPPASARGWYNQYNPYGDKVAMNGTPNAPHHAHSASPRGRHLADPLPPPSPQQEIRAKSEAYQPLRGASPPPLTRGNMNVPPLFGGERPVRDVLTPSFLGHNPKADSNALGAHNVASPYPGNAAVRKDIPWLDTQNTHRYTPTQQQQQQQTQQQQQQVGSGSAESRATDRRFAERYSRLTRDSSPAPPKRVFSSPPPSFRGVGADTSPHTPRGCSTDKFDQKSPGTPAGGGPIRFCGNQNRRASMLWDGTSEFIIEEQAEEDRGKYCVVLDLDETLVFARDGPIQLRPGCKELISALGEHCETVVWTAGERSYAKEVLRKLDEFGPIRHCVYRHHLWFNGKAGQVKDLRLLGRDNDRVLLVENTPDCLRKNATQSLLVPDFRGKCASNTLYSLAEFVKGLVRSDMPVSQYLRQSPLIAPRQVATNVGDTIFVHTLSVGTDAEFQNRAPNPDTRVAGGRSPGRY